MVGAITNYTALVLGAGASKTYGYPLGSTLRQEILDLSESDADAHGIIGRNYSSDRQHFFSFTKDFGLSDLYSIDAFLGRRPEYTEVGKKCIALTLLRKESVQALQPNDAEADHWYQYLWNHLAADSWDELDFSNIAVVTFNYDRSLEQYLLARIGPAYGKDEAEVLEKLRNLRIVHVYGSVGAALPTNANYFNYQEAITPMRVRTCAEMLNVIPEGRMNSETLQAARSLLSDAASIAFLGFGFDKINVERLAEGGACKVWVQRPNAKTMRTIVGTALGMYPLEASQAYSALTSEGHSTSSPCFVSQNCTQLLRSRQILM